MNELEIIITNKETQLNALKAASTAIVDACNKIVITNDTDLAVANQNLSKAKEKSRDIQKTGKALYEPYFKSYKKLYKITNDLSDPIDLSVKGGEQKIITYTKAVQAKKQAEFDRIAAIKADMTKYYGDAIDAFKFANTLEELLAFNDKYVAKFPEDKWTEFPADAFRLRTALHDFAKNRKIEIQNPTQADETVAEVIVEQVSIIAENVGAEKIEAVASQHEQKLTFNFTYEVVDQAAIPREFLMVDEKKVKAYIKEHKDSLEDGMVLNGLKFIQEDKVRIR